MNHSNPSKRPHRPSLTQHLQRMLHIDGIGNRHSTSLQVPSDAASPPTLQRQQSTQRAQAAQSCHVGNDKPPFVHTKKHNSYSQTSLGSRHTFTNGEYPEGLPKLPTHGVCLHESHTFSTPEEISNRSDICVSPTWTSNSAQRKERRVTLRLEAERVELEKKLMKLEQAESTQDFSALRRESRRLTKKQPFGTSTRASSVSADESRASKRFSSIFSNSRRSSRSRSRSSSLNEDNKGSARRQSFGPGEIPKPDLKSQSATPSLSTTLPERFATAISKELSVQSNPLLPNHTSFSRPQRSLHSDVAVTAVQRAGSSKPLGKDNANNLHRQGHRKPAQEVTQEDAPIRVSNVQVPDPPAELDRSSFTAALNLGQRAFDKVQSHGPLAQQTFPQNATARVEIPKKPVSDIHSSTNHPNLQNSLTTVQPVSSRRPPARTPPGKTRGRHKGFTSSPLSGFSTTNDTTSSSKTILTEQASATFIDTEPSTSSKLTLLLNSNSPHSISSLRPLSKNDKEDRQTLNGYIDITKKSQGNPLTRLLGDSIFLEENPRLHPSPSSFNTNPRGLSVSHQGSDQRSECPADPAQPQYHTMSQNALKSDSRPLPAIFTSLDEGASSQTALEAKETCLYGNPNLTGLGPPNPLFRSSPITTLDYRIERSSVSLSTTLSHEPESEEYNTADEVASSASESPNERYIPVKHPKNISAPTGVSTSVNKELSFGLHASPTADLNNVTLHPEQAAESSKQLRQGQLIAKLFVICCHCKFWHDMPSEVYARLAFPNKSFAPTDHSHHVPLIRKTTLNDEASDKATTGAVSGSFLHLSVAESASQKSIPVSRTGVQVPGPFVRCRWCEHHMSRECCQGWTTIVHLRERHH